MKEFNELLEVYNDLKSKHEVTKRLDKLVSAVNESINLVEEIKKYEINYINAYIVVTTIKMASKLVNSIAVELSIEFGVKSISTITAGQEVWIKTLEECLGMKGNYNDIHKFVDKAEAKEKCEDSDADFYIMDGEIKGVYIDDLLKFIDIGRIKELTEKIKELI